MTPVRYKTLVQMYERFELDYIGTARAVELFGCSKAQLYALKKEGLIEKALGSSGLNNYGGKGVLAFGQAQNGNFWRVTGKGVNFLVKNHDTGHEHISFFAERYLMR